ncbi:hypothetical protein CKAH01_14427 [Colletotrichum kahawae]|uniref:Uncharacterized protein n=1 Tax=Colletotrichum kahawae TaxID=34407 RepID=A0AAD9YMC1_COLKA|nr:hypothetical protein CKAH01_14427 [Colletotrichum kahawae]
MSAPDSPIRHSFELTRTLKACNLAFSELTAISEQIWDNRKNFRSFIGYCRLESSKEQIHKLRSIIKKCIQALELPTLFGKIDHCHRDTGRGMERVEDRLEELAECIKSMQQTQQFHRLTPSPQPEVPLSLERMVTQVKQDVQVLFDQQNSDSRLPRASAALFSQVFSALEIIHREVSKMTGTFTDLTHSNPEDSETELKVRNVGDEAELAIKELNASIISAASKLGSVSTTAPAQDSNPSTEKDLPPKKSVDGAIDEFRGLALDAKKTIGR